MLRTTIKNLLARKFRLVTTGIAVLLGVAFMAGSLVLTDTIGRTFDGIFAEVFQGTDAYVRAEEPFEGGGIDGPGSTRPRVEESLLEVVAAVDGVALAAPDVFGYSQLVDKEGKAVGNPSGGPPTFGGNWIENDDLNSFRIVEGGPPRADDEVVIDAGSAKTADYAVGDRAAVLTQAGPVDVTIVGIARFGSVDSPGGSTFVGFTLEAAQANIGQPGRLDGVTVLGEDGISQEELRDRIAAALPADHEAITGAELTKENQDDIREALAFFRTFMLIFAVIALFVGSFIIYNTFSILVAQRTREMALLRAIGASRRQVTTSLLVEALVVGLIASVLGIAAGAGLAVLLRALLGALGLDIPADGLVLTSGTILVSLVTGVVVAVFAAWFPARRGAKVPPIAAMRDVAFEQPGRPRLRAAIGIVMAALGVIALLVGLGGDTDSPLELVGLGAFLTILGVTALGPLAARPASRVLGSPLPPLRGLAGRLARDNAMRNPKRTATTASALLIGVTLVGFITIMAASIKASIDQTLDERFNGDFVLDSEAWGFGGISTTLAEELKALPELEAVSAYRVTPAQFDGRGTFLTGIDAEQMELITDIDVLQGDLADLDETGLAVHEDRADDKGWTLGSRVPVHFPETGPTELEVKVIYGESTLVGTYFVGLPVYQAHVADQYDVAVYAKVAEGISLEEARPVVEAITARYPNAELRDREEYKEAVGGQVDQMLTLVYALLLLAIIIALIGIANTLALSIVERTRELGLLRAVGMTRSQLRTMVRWESVLMALFGTVGGLGIGIFFGWAFVQALADQGFTALSIPVGQLLVIAVLAAFAGVVAAVLPARRAAKLDVLQAIATD